MKSETSTNNRLKNLDDYYDLIIVGGGIYGAALCWEASHRGIKTLLIEKDDYASGTSSNSLKTIHGGLRALQKFNIKAVFKGIRERSIYMSIAPNYVKLLPCILPTYKNLKKSKLFIGSGIFIYNFLQYLAEYLYQLRTKPVSTKLISLNEFKKRIKNINYKGITGGALWFDAQVTNTERLVLYFIKAATSKNAHALNHVEATKHSYDNNGHKIHLEDTIFNHNRSVSSGIMIDCTSSWNFIRNQYTEYFNTKKSTIFLKATNIIVKNNLFENAAGLNLKHPKSHVSRLFFFSPWRECTIIGTWYSLSKENPVNTFTRAEAKSCIEEINTAFDSNILSVNDICNVHIGHLPANKSIKSDKLNVDDTLLNKFQLINWSDQLNVNNLYTFRGTKYTLARDDAKTVINQLTKTILTSTKPSSSHHLPLYTKPVEIVNKYSISADILEHMVNDYASDYEKVLEVIETYPNSINLVPGTEHHISAEIYYAIKFEQALTLSDVLKRRLNIGDRSPPKQETTQHCADIMKEQLDWSDKERESQINDLYSSYPDFLTL